VRRAKSRWATSTPSRVEKRDYKLVFCGVCGQQIRAWRLERHRQSGECWSYWWDAAMDLQGYTLVGAFMSVLERSGVVRRRPTLYFQGEPVFQAWAPKWAVRVAGNVELRRLSNGTQRAEFVRDLAAGSASQRALAETDPVGSFLVWRVAIQ
jgi:hypothetical protein